MFPLLFERLAAFLGNLSASLKVSSLDTDLHFWITPSFLLGHRILNRINTNKSHGKFAVQQNQSIPGRESKFSTGDDTIR